MTESVLFNILYIAYFVTTLFYAFTIFTTRRGVVLAGRGLLLVTLLLHTAVIAERWGMAGRPPMSNMFETLVFLGWGIALVYLTVEIKYGLRVLGMPAVLAALLSLGLATLVFPGTIEPLMPALQNSFWLTTHVSFCFFGYGAFSIGYLMCLLLLIRRTDGHRNAGCYLVALSVTALVAPVVMIELRLHGVMTLTLTVPVAIAVTAVCAAVAGLLTVPVALLARVAKLDSTVKNPDVLETALHRTLLLGFLFLSIGIVTGSVWAQEAWGRYWGWDPKETWSFITWLIYGIHLHVRFGWQKRGVLTIWLAILGYWAVVFTYFGVNFLLSGLHSYAAS